MKKLIFLTIFVIILLTSPVSALEPGDLAPDFTLTDIDGNTFSLSDFEGKVVILSFFTSRCSACIYEMRHLKDVRNEFSEEELIMISLSIAPDYDTNERLRKFRDDEGINWTLARDIGRNVFESYGNKRIPWVFVINQSRRIKHEHLDWVNASVLIEEVNRLLSCSGIIQLSLSPNPVVVEETVTATASGLTNCDGKTVYIKEDSCSGTVSCSCSVYGSGCDCYFNAPSTEGDHTYYACIDKNDDGDFNDAGESDSEILNTYIPEPPEITITSPIYGGYYYKQYVPLEFTIDKPVEYIHYQVQGCHWGKHDFITGPINLTGLKDCDELYLTVWANDSYGNEVYSYAYFSYLGGDCTGPDGFPDESVNMRDIGFVVRYYGQTVPPAPQEVDMDGDGKINMRDIGFVASRFGNTMPAYMLPYAIGFDITLLAAFIAGILTAVEVVVVGLILKKFYGKK